MKPYFLAFTFILFLGSNGCSHWSKDRGFAIQVSTINFVPVNNPWDINKAIKRKMKKKPQSTMRAPANYYEYTLSGGVGGKLSEDFTKTIYQNEEHEGRLVITPYSRLVISLGDNRRLASFFAEHELELRDETGQVVPTYNDYRKGRFHVDIKGLDDFIKDSIVIQPKQYLGGGLVDSINKIYRLTIINKTSRKIIFAKDCITLFEASPFLLLQIAVIPKGAEGAGSEYTNEMLPKDYAFHPEYYHWMKRTSVTYDHHFFDSIVGKSYIRNYHQFPIRVELSPDYKGYAKGWIAYGDGLKKRIDEIRRTIGHDGILREVYHLYHTDKKRAPLFAWKNYVGKKMPYVYQVINADAGGGMRQRVRINYYTDYGHELGHTFNLGHNAGSELLYRWTGYNSFCYQKILPYFYEIKGTQGKGVLNKHLETWIGDSRNVIILRGGFHKPLTKIKIEDDKIILPMEKIGPIRKGLKEKERKKQNKRILAQKISQNDALYFFEPEQSGQYKLTLFYTPVDSEVYGDLLVNVHTESIVGTKDDLSANPNIELRLKKTKVRKSIMISAKHPVSKKSRKLSLENMTFFKGRSYPIFIHYEMTESGDREFKKSQLIFNRIEVAKQ